MTAPAAAAARMRNGRPANAGDVVHAVRTPCHPGQRVGRSPRASGARAGRTPPCGVRPRRLRDRRAPVDGVRDGGPELSRLRVYPLMVLSPTLAFWQTGPRTIRSREIRGSAVADDPVGHIGQGVARCSSTPPHNQRSSRHRSRFCRRRRRLHHPPVSPHRR